LKGKFGRTYKLDIFTPAGKRITIEPPLSIQFNISRNTLDSANTGSITIYNLAGGTRNQIYKDRYTTTEFWQVQLFAGYGNRIHQVIKGNIYEAYSYKQNTEWITKLEVYDGLDAIQNGFTSITIEKDTPKQNVIEQALSDMPNLIRGVLGSPIEGKSARGKSLIGQSYEIIQQETDNQAFIDNQVLNVLGNDEIIVGNIIYLDSSDLLATPRRRETFLDISILFEPQAAVARAYKIESLDPIYNGTYKIVGFTHDVEISSANSGKAITNISLNIGAEGLKERI